VQTAVWSFGGRDIIVNNVGYAWDTVIQKMTDEQWDRRGGTRPSRGGRGSEVLVEHLAHHVRIVVAQLGDEGLESVWG